MKKYLNYLLYFPRFFVARLIGWEEVAMDGILFWGVLGVPPVWHNDRLMVDKSGIKSRVPGVLKLLREWSRHKYLMQISPSYRMCNPAVGKAFRDGFAEGLRRGNEPMSPEERLKRMAEIANSPMIRQSARAATFFYEDTDQD